MDLSENFGVPDFRLQTFDIRAGIEIAPGSEIHGAELDLLEVVAIQINRRCLTRRIDAHGENGWIRTMHTPQNTSDGVTRPCWRFRRISRCLLGAVWLQDKFAPVGPGDRHGARVCNDGSRGLGAGVLFHLMALRDCCPGIARSVRCGFGWRRLVPESLPRGSPRAARPGRRRIAGRSPESGRRSNVANIIGLEDDCPNVQYVCFVALRRVSHVVPGKCVVGWRETRI